jgi:hypothetical protein
MSNRLEWDFKSSQNLQPDARQARALEYIAHYLDGIERHLGVISDRARQGNL